MSAQKLELLEWLFIFLSTGLVFIVGSIMFGWVLILRRFYVTRKFGLGYCANYEQPLSRVMRKCKTLPKGFGLRLRDKSFACEKGCEYWSDCRQSKSNVERELRETRPCYVKISQREAEKRLESISTYIGERTETHCEQEREHIEIELQRLGIDPDNPAVRRR